ncbi:MAG: cyclic nucleotide-binding domain-containing protein [Deltaproteobacteria bacterium]|nr:cyclic nucleotide-binding domain-containing protein [Deltaproteobacteria bacterium]
MREIPTLEEPTDLFTLGTEAFAEYKRELANCGIELPASVTLERVDGIVFYYSRDNGKIHVAVPPADDDSTVATYRFLWSSLLSLDAETLDSFLPMFVRRVVAHELGHALRDAYGHFGDNLWEEEQVANELAVALQNRRLSPEQRDAFKASVDRAMSALKGKVGSIKDVRMSYQSQLEVMYQTEQVGDSTRMAIEALGQAFDLEQSDILRSQVATGAATTVTDENEVIERFNTGGMGNLLHYLFFQLGWLQIDLAAQHTSYTQEFAANRLGLSPPSLRTPARAKVATKSQVRALHAASRACRALSNETAARWFYKRYRAYLVELLRGAEARPEVSTTTFRKDPAHLLETWEDSSRDRLDLLRAIAPADIRPLFPGRMAETAPDVDEVEVDLPHETDRAVWRRATLDSPDPAATATLQRLALLDRTQQFRALPARAMLDVAKHLFEVRLNDGETLFWRGEQNSDVFIVAEGTLEWSIGDEQDSPRGLRAVGEVVGEFAFLTGEPRSATVRAKGPARCFVIKAVDLRIQSGQHPSIMERIAAGLARRLRDK